MISVAQCLWYLIQHKTLVFRYGRLLRVPLWQLVTHDLSKLRKVQIQGYVAFHANKTVKTQGYYNALHDHIRSEPHHWNYWVVATIEGFLCVPMPDQYVREMIADWAACGMQNNGYFDLIDYYHAIRNTIIVHAETREKIERYISILVDEHIQGKIPRTT